MADTQTQSATGTVVGYFDRYSDAQHAVSGLQDAGFKANQIGLAARSASEGNDYSDNTTLGSSSTTGSSMGQTASGAAHKAGAKAEGVWDKVKNFFEGGTAEPYAEENTRGDMATREITTAGSGYDDYDTEAFRGSLSGMSVPDEHSRYFSHRFENSSNGAIVTVSAPGREAEAQSILQQYGADLGSNAASYDYSSTASTAGRQVEGQQRIQLLGEVLRVHKDRINRGEVRIRKEVITDQQMIQVPVTREELVVERVPVSGDRAAQGTIGENSEIRIPLTEERAGIDKQTVVREEVNVGKRAVENVRNLQGEVRHEELVVNDETKANATTDRTNLRGSSLTDETLDDTTTRKNKF